MKYIMENNVDIMLGCASFSGNQVEKHKDILAYLHHSYPCEPHLMPEPIVDNYVSIAEICEKEPELEMAQQSVPTLLRGYIKLGARVSDTAIIDSVFNSVFVAIYVKADKMIANNHTLVSQS